MIWGESGPPSLRCRLVGGEAGSRESTRYRAVDIPSRNSFKILLSLFPIGVVYLELLQ